MLLQSSSASREEDPCCVHVYIIYVRAYPDSSLQDMLCTAMFCACVKNNLHVGMH